MAAFTITNVSFGNTPSGDQTMGFQYKLWSDPESAYITLSTNSVVNINGQLISPITVTGLQPNTLYYIRGYNTCDSPVDYFVQQIMTNGLVTTFWNIYPSDTEYATDFNGNISNAWIMNNVPLDVASYNNAYFSISTQLAPNNILFGSNVITQTNSPDWASNPSDPAQAIVDWVVNILQDATGDLISSYFNIADGIILSGSYGVSKIPAGLGIPYDDLEGQPSIVWNDDYNFGLLNLPLSILIFQLKFSKTQ